MASLEEARRQVAQSRAQDSEEQRRRDEVCASRTRAVYQLAERDTPTWADVIARIASKGFSKELRLCWTTKERIFLAPLIRWYVHDRGSEDRMLDDTGINRVMHYDLYSYLRRLGKGQPGGSFLGVYCDAVSEVLGTPLILQNYYYDLNGLRLGLHLL